MRHKRFLKIFILGLFIGLFCSSPIGAVENGPVGRVANLQGVAKIVTEEEETHIARMGDEIYLHDKVITGANSKIQILFIDESILNLGARGECQVKEFFFDRKENLRQSVFALAKGKLRTTVTRVFSKDSRFDIQTQTAVAGVRGTVFVVIFNPEVGITEVISIAGDVQVKNILAGITEAVTVSSHYISQVRKGQPPTPPLPVLDSVIEQLEQDTTVLFGEEGPEEAEAEELGEEEEAEEAREEELVEELEELPTVDELMEADIIIEEPSIDLPPISQEPGGDLGGVRIGW